MPLILPAPGVSRERGSSPVLIGRDEELRVLVEAVSRPPAVVMVEGEAGVGKTRLVREALDHPALEDRQRLVGHCHRVRDPFPLGPVIEALRGADVEPRARFMTPVVGALRPLLPELAAHLPPCPEPLPDPRAQRHRTFRALRDLLEALGPVVYVFEDLHWGEEATLELVSFLMSEPPRELALILTYRAQEPDGPASLLRALSHPSSDVLRTRIELPPLSEAEVRALTCAVLEVDDVSEEVACHLHERTAGLPFVVEEVLQVLRDRADVSAVAQATSPSELDALEVPPAVRMAILERFGSLGPDARLVARTAAVLENPTGEDLLTRASGLSPTRARSGLTQALGANLLVEKDRSQYDFRHALAAQAVYDELPGPERRWLHRRAARALEEGAAPLPLAQIAHHFKQADRPKEWARYAEAAAKSARGAGDDGSATQLLEEALTTPGLGHAARVRMAIELGTAALYSVAPHSAIELLQRTLDEERLTAGARGELRFSLCRLRFHAGDAGNWREQMVEAVDELQHRPALAVRAMINLAQPARLTEGRREDHLAWLERATKAVAGQHDPVAQIAVSAQRAAILLTIGDPGGWAAVEAIPTEVGSAEERLQLLRGYHSVAQAAIDLGYYRRAEALLASAEAIYRELDHTWWRLWLASTRAALDWAEGRWEGLSADARSLVASTADTPGASLEDHVVLGSLLLSHGDLEDAEHSLAWTLDAARTALWLPPLVASAGQLARLHLAQGAVDAAAEVTALGLDAVRRKELWPCAARIAPVAVDAFLARGDGPAAARLYEEFAGGIRKRDAPAARAALAVCQGAIAEADGRHAAACGAFARAERAWRGLPNPYAAAQARERRAVCLLGQGDDREGEVLIGALETFERLGARWDATRVRARLKARGMVLPYPLRGGRKSYGRELSPKEAEVARLAGMGWSNKQIADKLFISPHTVAGHVSSALRKLGVSSRQELSANTEDAAPSS